MRLLLLCLISVVSMVMNGQNEKEKLRFELEENYETEVVNDSFDESLLYNPIDLNNTSYDELKNSGLFTEKEIENILFYLYVYGEMKSIYEMKLIKDMDYNTIQRLLPFITITPKKKEFKNSLSQQINISVRTNLSVPDGFRDKTDSLLRNNKKYLGDPVYLAFNYEGQLNRSFKWGISCEKDAGELMNTIPDYTSFFLEYTTKSWLKKLVIGSYKLCFGNGLVMNNTYETGFTSLHSFSKSASNTVRKHNSFNETDYQRGAAAVFKIRNTELTLFGSFVAKDASSNDSVIHSFYTSGKHNTAASLSRKKNETVQSYGIRGSFSRKNYSLGVNYVNTTFSKPVFSKYQSVANRFHFKGKESNSVSLDWEYSNKKLRIGGEEAFSDKGVALLNRVQFQPKRDFLFSFAQRYYSPQYYSYNGRALGNSLIRNEEGYYFFSALYFGKGFYFNVSYDYFKYLWASAGSDFPKESSDLKLRLENKLLNKWIFSLLYKQSRREKEYDSVYDESYTWILRSLYKSVLSLRVTHEYSKYFLSQSLLEYAFIQGDKSNKGFHLSQIFTCSLMQGSCQFQTIVSAFYGGENISFYSPVRHSLYAGSGERISGNGFKFQGNARVKLYKDLSIQFSYSLLHRSDVTFIGNGLERIQSNQRHMISSLIRYKF